MIRSPQEFIWLHVQSLGKSLKIWQVWSLQFQYLTTKVPQRNIQEKSLLILHDSRSCQIISLEDNFGRNTNSVLNFGVLHLQSLKCTSTYFTSPTGSNRNQPNPYNLIPSPTKTQAQLINNTRPLSLKPTRPTINTLFQFTRPPNVTQI